MVKVIVIVRLGVKQICFTVALTGTVAAPATSVQKLLTAGSPHARPVPGLGQHVSPLPLLVRAVVARAVGQSLK